MQFYKVFNSTEFVNRAQEWERLRTFLKERSRGVIIFEGERGAGKTSLLLEMYRRFLKLSELSPFFISLSPYSAPEFESNKNIWIREKEFQSEDIPALLNQLADSLEIEFIQSDDREIKKEYLARGLAYRASKTIPVLLMDSIYECSEEVRIEIEKYVLAPILTSERVFILLSGRGKRPVWSRPELQMAEIIKLNPLTEEYVKEQLEKMNSPRARDYQKIAELSGGYPLIVNIMGKSERSLTETLNEAIDIIIQETLPKGLRDSEKYDELRRQIDKLSLVNIPFRIPDVEDYLYPREDEQRAKTNDLINLLLTSRILRYEGKGYQLNESITHPIRIWLSQAMYTEYKANLIELKRVRNKLQEEYPSAESWYQRMLPEGAPSNNLPNHLQARHTA